MHLRQLLGQFVTQAAPKVGVIYQQAAAFQAIRQVPVKSFTICVRQLTMDVSNQFSVTQMAE
jgi:hypothetical protein